MDRDKLTLVSWGQWADTTGLKPRLRPPALAWHPEALGSIPSTKVATPTSADRDLASSPVLPGPWLASGKWFPHANMWVGNLQGPWPSALLHQPTDKAKPSGLNAKQFQLRRKRWTLSPLEFVKKHCVLSLGEHSNLLGRFAWNWTPVNTGFWPTMAPLPFRLSSGTHR